MASDERIEKLRTVLKNRQVDLKVILEDIHDPHNVNAIYRSCEAVGVMDVISLYMKEEFPEIKFNLFLLQIFLNYFLYFSPSINLKF